MDQEESLYEKIGGYDGITDIMDDFIGEIVVDEQLGRFFIGHSTDSKKRIRQQMIEFVCNASGGSCNYTGRDLFVAHQGLDISEDDWELSLKYLEESLEKYHVSGEDKKTLVEMITEIKEDIVEA